MKILHLCSDYPFTNLYKELAQSLDATGLEQLFYIPLRKDKEFKGNIDYKIGNINFIYSTVFDNVDRLFYTQKINKIFCDIKNKVDFKNIDLVHAHFLFSMGGIALKLKIEKNIDYIVAVRSTDINLFFKYLSYLRGVGLKILKNSKKIIFISPAYLELFLGKNIPNSVKESIVKKSIVIPNGINSFFLRNKNNKLRFNNGKDIKLLYVGSFLKRKNVHIVIAVTRKLKSLGYKVKLLIVGSGGGDEYKIRKLVKKHNDFIEIYNRIEEKEELLNIYRKSDIFVMPSYNETFGLVYLEAMSQGLPIIYTKGEGFDGYFMDGKVGYSVNPKDINDIVEKIEMIIYDYNSISKNCYNLVEKFSWDDIAEKYNNIYKSIF